MGFRSSGTYDTIVSIAGMSLFAFPLLYSVITYQLLGLGVVLGGVVLVLYLRHPRRKEHEELDEKLGEDRWDHGRARYIEEVEKRDLERE
jgi:hypothetical protein